MHRIPVRQIMQTSVITIHAEALVPDAAQLMEEFNIRRLPVVDDAGCLIGIVTDSDVREVEMAGSVLNNYEPGLEAEWLTVGDIMSRDVITIQATATVGELAAKLAKHKIGGVPVVESDPQQPKCLHLTGIVSEIDIFTMLAAAWHAENGQPLILPD